MEIGGYKLEPTIVIGVIQIVVGVLGLFFNKTSCVADRGSFVNTGANYGSVRIDNSQKIQGHCKNQSWTKLIFKTLIVVGIIFTFFGLSYGI
ncbi:hypothetical protein DSECCO2_223830 [anaerobic digester metagenome]